MRILAMLALLNGIRILYGGTAYAAGVVGSGNATGCTKAALDSALLGGGTVTFNCGGGPVTITDTLTISSDTTLDGSGQQITIDGGGSGPAVTVGTGVTVTLIHVTLSNSVSFFGFGGGIFNSGTVMLLNSVVSGASVGTGGGGIYNNGGTVDLVKSTLSNNSAAAGAGGGIDNEGNGTVTITNSVLNNNSAGSGGGIYNNGAEITITNSSVSNNTGLGGGIYNSPVGTVTLINSTLNSNAALGGIGGGIYNEGTTTLSNSTLSGNSADLGNGGGMYVNAGTVSISSSTLSGNSAGTGGGIWNLGGTVTLSKSILAGNTDSTGKPDCFGAVTSNDYNIIGVTAGCTITGTTTHDQHNVNPGLAAVLANNGGPTQTIALLSSSPAISQIPAATCPGTDQRGYLRKAPACDIGAYETSTSPDTSKPTCTIKVSAGPPATATFTVQDAVAGLEQVEVTQANNVTFSPISFSAGDTSALLITFTKMDQSLKARVGLQVTDLAGNVTICDPVFADISQDGHRPSMQFFTDVDQGDHVLHIANGNPGISRLFVVVNRRTFQLLNLVPDQQITLDIAPALHAGLHNMVLCIARGRQAGGATLVLADS